MGKLMRAGDCAGAILLQMLSACAGIDSAWGQEGIERAYPKAQYNPP